MRCQTISNGKECGKEAKYKVIARWNNFISFLVCEECIPAYKHIQMKEYGNTQSNFIVEELKEVVKLGLDEKEKEVVKE